MKFEGNNITQSQMRDALATEIRNAVRRWIMHDDPYTRPSLQECIATAIDNAMSPRLLEEFPGEAKRNGHIELAFRRIG